MLGFVEAEEEPFSGEADDFAIPSRGSTYRRTRSMRVFQAKNRQAKLKRESRAKPNVRILTTR